MSKKSKREFIEALIQIPIILFVSVTSIGCSLFLLRFVGIYFHLITC